MINTNTIEIILLLRDGADKEGAIKALEKNLQGVRVFSCADSYITAAVSARDYVAIFHGEVREGTGASMVKKPEVPSSITDYVMKVYPVCGQSISARNSAYSR
jgi:hypothetical protein